MTFDELREFVYALRSKYRKQNVPWGIHNFFELYPDDSDFHRADIIVQVVIGKNAYRSTLSFKKEHLECLCVESVWKAIHHALIQNFMLCSEIPYRQMCDEFDYKIWDEVYVKPLTVVLNE